MTAIPLALSLGDPAGIGPEIIAEAKRLLEAIGTAYDVEFACEDQLIGGAADGNQAEQNQLRRVQRVADGCGHGRACDRRRIAARRDQECNAGLLAQRLDDGADQQAGEQPLRHRAHGVDAVAVRRDNNVLAL